MAVRILQMMLAFASGMLVLSVSVKFEGVSDASVQDEEVKVTKEFYETCVEDSQEEPAVR